MQIILENLQRNHFSIRKKELFGVKWNISPIVKNSKPVFMNLGLLEFRGSYDYNA